MELERLTVVIDADSSQAVSAMNRLKSEMGSVSKSVDNSMSSVKNTMGQINKSLSDNGISASFASIGNSSTKAVEGMERLNSKIAITEMKIKTLALQYQKLLASGDNAKLSSFVSENGIDTGAWNKYLDALKKYKSSVANGEVDFDDSALTAIPKSVNEVLEATDKLNSVMTATFEIDTDALSDTEGILSNIESIITELELKKLEPLTPESTMQIKEYTKQLSSLLTQWAKLNGIPVALKYSAFSQQQPELYKRVTEAQKVPEKKESPIDLGKSVGTITKALLGIRSIYMLIRKIINQNEQLTTSINNLFSTLGALLKPILDVLAKIINTISVAFNEVFKLDTEGNNTSSKIERTIASFDELERVSSSESSVKVGVYDWLKNILEKILSAITFKNYEYKTVEGSINTGEGDIIDYMPSVSNFIAPAIEWLYNLTRDGGKISTFFSDAIESIKLDFSNAYETLKETTLDPISKWAKNLWTNFSDGCKKSVKTITETISGCWTSIKKSFDDFIGLIKAGIKSAINWVISKIESMINGIAKTVNDGGFIKGFNKLFGVELKLPTVSIPRLYKGGVVSTPTIAMVGDAGIGNPEIVAPQSVLNNMLVSNNAELVRAFAQMTSQIITAINNNEMTVNLDGTAIAKSVSKANNDYKLRTGRTLIGGAY